MNPLDPYLAGLSQLNWISVLLPLLNAWGGLVMFLFGTAMTGFLYAYRQCRASSAPSAPPSRLTRWFWAILCVLCVMGLFLHLYAFPVLSEWYNLRHGDRQLGSDDQRGCRKPQETGGQFESQSFVLHCLAVKTRVETGKPLLDAHNIVVGKIYDRAFSVVVYALVTGLVLLILYGASIRMAQTAYLHDVPTYARTARAGGK